MAWIESHQSLLTHRKTSRAVARLRVDRHKFLGHLHCLWYWGLDNADQDGVLGETFPEEIAEAAGWPMKRAGEFVQALVAARFLDDVDGKLSFHNWARYTWRFYDGVAKRRNASESGAFGNHKRWHVDRGIIAPDCEFCIAPDTAPDSGSSSPRLASDIATSPTPPHLTEPTDPNRPILATVRTRQERTTALRDALQFSPDEWRELIDGNPGVNVNARWLEWISWILDEEEEGREKRPKNKIEAFKGFLKKQHRVSEKAGEYSVASK